jgi:putative NADH-flavin reductase
MKIAIIGATGRTGSLVLEQAVARGDEVVAIARNPQKVGEALPPSVRVAQAEAADSDAIRRAITGSDAVVFALGHVAGGSATVQADGIRATLTAMSGAGVRRLVAISASGPTVDGDDPLQRFVAKPILWRILRDQWNDMLAMEREIVASGADWTIMRPPMLTDAPARARYRSRSDGNVRWGIRIGRADLARAILDALDKPAAIGQKISLAR